MQIVIDIIDDDYNRINSYPDGRTFYPITARLYKAVKDGTPLPKGHGDLIDKKVAFMKVGAYLDGYDKGLEVLDKIRAELHATAEMHEDENYYLREEWIDEIIDKYRKEQE